MNEVTIGIPSYNEEGNITNLLKSIFSSNIDKNLIKEVIISDDSTDSTPQLIQNFKERNPSLNVKLYHHDVRRGTAAAWNEIFKEAMEKIIILFDADVIVGGFIGQRKTSRTVRNESKANRNNRYHWKSLFLYYGMASLAEKEGTVQIYSHGESIVYLFRSRKKHSNTTRNYSSRSLSSVFGAERSLRCYL
jgi:cellulose synthase/poly-beta-1,6-N-acetylglucosamine synthase-like glycosyltransferase